MTESILSIKMQENDADAWTVGEYLAKLLAAVWEEGESFSGKRPFGNSDWEYEVYAALIKAGAIDGALDEWGYITRVDERAAHKLVANTIRLAFVLPQRQANA